MPANDPSGALALGPTSGIKRVAVEGSVHTALDLPDVGSASGRRRGGCEVVAGEGSTSSASESESESEDPSLLLLSPSLP